ncbi:unnamed protein product [Peronospora destructor]|uniref:Uncharacterized protein n=1 Tax=Peronospora destructor TaxID=86335 RepID=A0AAV0V9J3_9STRA|nr:unnamed protein product [Peronospora destructor]
MAWRVKVDFVRQLGGTVTTQSLYSKVFTVEGSLPRRRQMLLSLRALTISIVNALSINDIVHLYVLTHSADCTSYTAFLDDSHFTQDLRLRQRVLLAYHLWIG